MRGTIRAIHEVSGGTYGAPRVHAELMAGGCRVSRKRVARLMREAGLAGVSRRRGMRTTRVDQSHCVVPDRVERQFQADAPDRLWVADVTYVPTWTGFVYLAIVLDVFSRRVVGWSMTHHLRTELVLGALNMALGQRRPDGVVHHSDRGSQYTSLAFGKRCREMGVVPSTGSAGDCFDNAMAESFFATLECELIDRRSFRTQAEARLAIIQFIEGWYNPRRRHSALGYLSPNDYERSAAKETPRAVRNAHRPARAVPGASRSSEPKVKTYPRGHPIYRIGRRLYVHRLSPTSGLGTTALNCPLKRGNSRGLVGRGRSPPKDKISHLVATPIGLHAPLLMPPAHPHILSRREPAPNVLTKIWTNPPRLKLDSKSKIKAHYKVCPVVHRTSFHRLSGQTSRQSSQEGEPLKTISPATGKIRAGSLSPAARGLKDARGRNPHSA